MNNLFNLRTFFKFLGKNKLYTAIDIFGLSVSLMFVILIAVYTTQELSTDKYHKKADRIYALANEQGFGTAFRLAYKIQERYPEVEKVCPIAIWEPWAITVNESKFKINFSFVDSTFFDFFDFKLYHTDAKNALIARNYAVISRTFARKAFGNEDPIGKTVALHDSLYVTVNGVMDDIKNSCMPYCDLVARIDNIRHFNPSMDSDRFNNAGSAYMFIMEKKGADLRAKTEAMLEYFKEIFWIYKNGMYKKVDLVPLKEVYFSGKDGNLRTGNWSMVMILMSIGFVILIFAIINYVNLTVAQAGFRAKEMATRRLLGSSKRELFVRLLLESTLLCLISFLIALFLAALCVSSADGLLKTKIDLAGAFSVSGIAISAGTVLILGTISGWLPAMMISNADPMDVTRGSFGRKYKMVFSRFFIVFQNVITIMLLVASITMTRQTFYLIDAPLGYNTRNIIVIDNVQNLETRENIKLFAERSQQLASVKRVGLAQGTPFNRGNNNTIRYKDKNIGFQTLAGDSTYFNMLGIQKIRENNLGGTRGFNVYFSQQALKETELDEDATEFRFGENGEHSLNIAGVVKDIQLVNITHRAYPLLLQYLDFEQRWPWNILVEIQGDPRAAFNQVKQVFEEIAEVDFEGEFLDGQIAKSFDSQRRTAQIVLIFTAIAVLISLLGLLAMSNYFIRQHTREIAIRKAYGADNFAMLTRLILTFLSYVGIAFVIAVAPIWYIMQKWLSDYSYRIDLSPLIFIAAGGFCLTVSFVSVYWQSRAAANANPVKTLKS